MRRFLPKLSPLIFICIFFTACGTIGDKSTSLSAIYCIAAILSLILLVVYCCIAKKRELWFLLLFISVLVVNAGYFALSVSKGLGEALLANRLSYLGSVFLPLSMLMIIINATNMSYKKQLPSILFGLAIVVFLVAASPGYLPIYYKEVSFVIVDGVATLQKVYGPLHILYLIYLLGYFAAMIATIVHATLKDKIDSLAYAVIIAIAVFVNIGVWMIEQLVYIDFEFLSISYIISESFLLGLHILMAEAEKLKAGTPSSGEALPTAQQEYVCQSYKQEDMEKLELFIAGLKLLTPKEQELYDCYVSGLTTDVIMDRLNIKENTLKFHSKNLYAKLDVKSRKQLMELHNYKEIKSRRSR